MVLAPMVIGILVASIGMSFGATTGYALNPARDFGPRLAYFILPIPNREQRIGNMHGYHLLDH